MSSSGSLEHWNIPSSGKGDLADGIKSRVWGAGVMLGEPGEPDVITGALQGEAGRLGRTEASLWRWREGPEAAKRRWPCAGGQARKEVFAPSLPEEPALLTLELQAVGLSWVSAPELCEHRPGCVKPPNMVRAAIGKESGCWDESPHSRRHPPSPPGSQWEAEEAALPLPSVCEDSGLTASCAPGHRLPGV